MRETGRLIKRANLQLARELDQFAKVFGLTGTQMSILDFIFQATEETYLQRDIEQEFHIQRSTATGILQGMEKKGLISRHISSHDARQRSILLTSKGSEIALSCQDFFREQERNFTQRFSEEERRIFQKILTEITQKEIKDVI
ncbi:MarR family winged helix-turn-helix transcriptional regulator [Streptococcus saliviloxodontae]|uniref:DNA-binding MarR family transcriptional regulator n=1 Tax=Streptococcus saliviloxodontae TaxID=1349416 RepID=A0ABS2PLH2_9STRE|nr:MarR family winged helix-turn-helix transcriptional regulator [Streptococcus saliviloxodontae]MBM7636273.1 DNA-binding MarR family transcriptional regulator [Streptococcus saliviloxodontae]